LAHKEREHEYQRKWRKANPEKYREQQRRYRKNHPEKKAREDQLWRWRNKDKVAEWSKQWCDAHRNEIRERDRQKTRLKRVVPYLTQLGVLNDDDLLAIQHQRESRLPLSKTILYINDRVRVAQESWNRDEVAGATPERRTFKMFLSHLHEAGALDDNDLRIITHQRKAHLRHYETISYVGDRIVATQRTRNDSTLQPSKPTFDDVQKVMDLDEDKDNREGRTMDPTIMEEGGEVAEDFRS